MALLRKAISPVMSARYDGPSISFKSWNPGQSLFGAYKSDAFDSAFPNIRPIVNEYMTVMPYAIDGNGKPVQNNAIINALYHPNREDSSVAFFEKMAVSTLFHRKTYVLVWRREGSEAKPGGEITRDNIAGFTFLEFPGITRREGRTYYSIGAQEFSDKEVIVLPGGVDPNNLYGGYSPSIASCRWAKLDDYIADYQVGFFENNAIPAGTFIITAATPTEYDDMVDMLQKRHKGAGNNNNVTYSHRPIDPMSQKPAAAQIEWVPFSQSNKDIDFKNIFEQTNKRQSTSYGVSQFIQGVDDAPNYATAQVSDRNFSKRAVYPLLLRNWTQFTHELNRITGGIGVAITFNYEMPAVADEEKVEAATNNIRVDTVLKLLDKGYTLNSIVDTLKLPNNFKLLKTGNEQTKIENDKPDVDEGGEVEKSPDPNKIDGITPTNEAAKSKNPKVKDQLKETDAESYQEQLAIVIREHMQRQVDEAIADSDASPENKVDTNVEEFTDDLMRVIVAVMVASGDLQYNEGMSLLIAAGINVDNLSSFSLTQTHIDAYRAYLADVAQSYTDDTAASIRNVLDRANAEGWNRNELQTALRNIMSTDEWRVTRLAQSELNRSQQMGSLRSMQQIQDEVEDEAELTKTWNRSKIESCEFCAALEGKTIPINESFVGEGGKVQGTDGGTFVNNFVAVEVCQLHPHDGCYITYNVERKK